MAPRISTVLLDAGGVLLDEAGMEAARARATADFLRTHVPGYDLARYRADTEDAVRSFAPNTYLAVFWKHFRPHRERCEAMFAEFGRQWRTLRPPLELMRGVAGELRLLSARFRLAAAGQYGAELFDLLDRHDLARHFSWRLTQEDFELTKPDPRYLVAIADACGVDPRACVMVGDRIDKDVVPARQAGMRTVRIRLGLHKRQEARTPDELPDAELESVAGLARTVEGLALNPQEVRASP